MKGHEPGLSLNCHDSSGRYMDQLRMPLPRDGLPVNYSWSNSGITWYSIRLLIDSQRHHYWTSGAEVCPTPNIANWSWSTLPPWWDLPTLAKEVLLMNGPRYSHMNWLFLICKSGSLSLGDNGIQDHTRCVTFRENLSPKNYFQWSPSCRFQHVLMVKWWMKDLSMQPGPVKPRCCS